MADRNTLIKANQIVKDGAGTIVDISGALGVGLNAIDTNHIVTDDIAGAGLSVVDADSPLDVNVDDVTIEISGNNLQVVDSGITDAKLANDYIQTFEVSRGIAWDGENDELFIYRDLDIFELEGGDSGVFTIKDAGITEAKLDINSAPVNGEVLYWNESAGKLDYASPDMVVAEKENQSANCDGAITEFTLGQTPVENSLQVYLNGILQESGSGNDYTLAGDTISFAIAPASDDILVIHYIV